MRLKLINSAGETIYVDGNEYINIGNNADAAFEYFKSVFPGVASYEVDSSDDVAQAKKSAYAEINQQYATEIANIREAIRLVLDRGGDATSLRAKLTAKQAEYKAALLGVS